MLIDVVDALFVPSGATSVQYSQGFALNNDNNVTADILLISATATTGASVYFQMSDDKQNWVTHTTSVVSFASGDAPRKATLSATGIVSAYGRFKFHATAADCLFKTSAFTKRT